MRSEGFRISTRPIVSIIILLLFLLTQQSLGSNNFSIHLSGDRVVPSVDTKAQGQATFNLGKDGTGLEYKLNATQITQVTAVLLYLGASGENGDPVADLLNGSRPKKNGIQLEGTITPNDLMGPLSGETLEALVSEMRQGLAYVNIHTAAYPSGEIRGPPGAWAEKWPSSDGGSGPGAN